MNHITLNQDSRKKVKGEMKAAQIKGEKRYYNRLQAFLLLDLRLSLAEVAEFLRHTLRTLYTWLQLFITKGIKGLKPKSPKGRKAKLSKRISIRPLDSGYDSKAYSPALEKRICYQIHS